MSDTLFPNGAALIFGGSGGIGSGVAREFANAGSSVAIVYRSKHDVAQTLADALKSDVVATSIHAADVCDSAQVAAAVASAKAAHGHIHTIVWCAGRLADQVLISETSPEQWKEAIDVEVHGFFNVVQATLPLLREQGGGSYVTLGSAGQLR